MCFSESKFAFFGGSDFGTVAGKSYTNHPDRLVGYNPLLSTNPGLQFRDVGVGARYQKEPNLRSIYCLEGPSSSTAQGIYMVINRCNDLTQPIRRVVVLLMSLSSLVFNH